VESLPVSTRSPCENRYSDVGGQKLQDTFEERLRDNTQTPVPDQAAFRIDWPAWLNSRTDRDRRILNAMATGERTQNLARKFKISPARISQLRRECHADWLRFCGEGANESIEAQVATA
jgi:DNA-binding NarL/FixJ family response regulator